MFALFVAKKSPKAVKVEILATQLNQAVSTNFACSFTLTFSSTLVTVTLNLNTTPVNVTKCNMHVCGTPLV